MPLDLTPAQKEQLFDTLDDAIVGVGEHRFSYDEARDAIQSLLHSNARGVPGLTLLLKLTEREIAQVAKSGLPPAPTVTRTPSSHIAAPITSPVPVTPRTTISQPSFSAQIAPVATISLQKSPFAA